MKKIMDTVVTYVALLVGMLMICMSTWVVLNHVFKQSYVPEVHFIRDRQHYMRMNPKRTGLSDWSQMYEGIGVIACRYPGATFGDVYESEYFYYGHMVDSYRVDYYKPGDEEPSGYVEVSKWEIEHTSQKEFGF